MRKCEEIWLSLLSSSSSPVGGGDILAQNLYTSMHFKTVNDCLTKAHKARVGADAAGLAIGDCSD
jgi:hypothetical protein